MMLRAGSEFGRLLVLGYGVTGQAVCAYCQRHGLHVAVSESGELAESQQHALRAQHIPFEHGGHTDRFLDDTDTIVLSPGVSPRILLLDEARSRGHAVLSEIDWAWDKLPDCRSIAVTGTNGKSSTVQVIAALLHWHGVRAVAAGNIGIPLISVADTVRATDVLVIEVSSYQLEQSSRLRPDVAILLNLTADHLQRHGTLRAYLDAKSRVFLQQTDTDAALIPKALDSEVDTGRARRILYDEAPLPLPREAAVLYPHERSNLRAALLAVHLLDPTFPVGEVPLSVLKAAFRMPHRMEYVGTVRGVDIINDSKSTNAASTIAALDALPGGIVLLLGGRKKQGGYDALRDRIAEKPLRSVVCFGEDGAFFEKLLTPVGVPLLVAETLAEAIDAGLGIAKSGECLLLSPACASFDQFRSFEHRGEVFEALVRTQQGFRSSAMEGRRS